MILVQVLATNYGRGPNVRESLKPSKCYLVTFITCPLGKTRPRVRLYALCAGVRAALIYQVSDLQHRAPGNKNRGRTSVNSEGSLYILQRNFQFRDDGHVHTCFLSFQVYEYRKLPKSRGPGGTSLSGLGTAVQPWAAGCMSAGGFHGRGHQETGASGTSPPTLSLSSPSPVLPPSCCSIPNLTLSSRPQGGEGVGAAATSILEWAVQRVSSSGPPSFGPWNTTLARAGCDAIPEWASGSPIDRSKLGDTPPWFDATCGNTALCQPYSATPNSWAFRCKCEFGYKVGRPDASRPVTGSGINGSVLNGTGISAAGGVIWNEGKV